MNAKYLILILFCSPVLLWAQNAERSVIASGGTSLTLPNMQVDYTIGEVVIATNITPNNVITQGFHQPLAPGGSGAVQSVIAMGIKIYPNPAERILFFEVPETGSIVRIELFNALGQVVKYKEQENSTLTGLLQLDISDLAPGFYPLRIAAGSESAHTVIVKK